MEAASFHPRKRPWVLKAQRHASADKRSKTVSGGFLEIRQRSAPETASGVGGGSEMGASGATHLPNTCQLDTLWPCAGRCSRIPASTSRATMRSRTLRQELHGGLKEVELSSLTSLYRKLSSAEKEGYCGIVHICQSAFLDSEATARCVMSRKGVRLLWVCFVGSVFL